MVGENTCQDCGRQKQRGALPVGDECSAFTGHPRSVRICQVTALAFRRGMREAFSAAIAACTDAIAGDWDPSWRAGATCALELVEMRAGLRCPETGKPIEKAVADAE